MHIYARTQILISLCRLLGLLYLIKNTPGVKKGGQELKIGLVEKDVKSNGQPMPSGCNRLESFNHDAKLKDLKI